MNDSKISVRYSRAIFELAVERKILDKVNQDMVLISEICKLPEAKDLLLNPVLVPSKKSAILHKILEGNIEQTTLSLVDLVLQNGRESFIPAIAREFIHQTLKYKGITRSVLTTAVKVDSRIKKQISEMIARVFNTNAEIEEIIDTDIIGGFILRIDDNYIDASIRNNLRKIKKELRGRALAS